MKLQSQAQDQSDTYDQSDSRSQTQISNQTQVQNESNPQGSSQTQLDVNTSETFHNFSNLPIELQREIWKFAAIPHHRAIQIETRFDGIKVESNGDRVAVWRNQITSPCYPNALFETCRNSRRIALTKYEHSEDDESSTPLAEKCTIPRRLYYNVDNDILWMKDDPLLKTASEGTYDIQLYTSHDEQFANIAIDLEKFFPTHFAQSQTNVSHEDLVRPSEVIRILPFHANLALKKIYLVYSRANQRDLATDVVKSLVKYMKEDEEVNREFFDSIMIRKGMKGQLWRWPVLAAILESDLLADKKDSRGNVILR